MSFLRGNPWDLSVLTTVFSVKISFLVSELNLESDIPITIATTGDITAITKTRLLEFLQEFEYASPYY